MFGKKKGIAVFTACLLLYMSVHAGERALMQQKIASEVLRFHVLANSDSEEDQAVKYQVRDAVLAWLEEELQVIEEKQEAEFLEKRSDEGRSGVLDGREETMKLLQGRLAELEAVADGVLDEAGMAYCASAEVTRCYFPDRTYGSCTFAAGWYDALRIRLGEAKGQNWWCVLYPRLCFQDCLHAVMEDEQLQELQEVLTVEEYESLLTQPQKWKLAFRWF